MKENKKYPIFWDTDIPLRSIRGPLYDQHKFKKIRGKEMIIPVRGASTLPNVAIPDQMMNLHDLTYSFFGPPDNQVRPGFVGKIKKALVLNFNGNERYHRYDGSYDLLANVDKSFQNASPDNIELFVDSPFAVKTDLPCSVLGFKY